jgi:hypothetical protein
VASQVGSLPDVNVLTTAVDHVHGGLGVSFDSSGKVQNSVRDVAIANGILFVCDEPEKVVDLYALADGRYLGSSNALSTSPTHLATNNGGLYVSAVLGAAAAIRIGGVNILAAVALTPPSSKDPLKIGGISFDGASRLYIPFQEGTGDSKKAGGSIYGYGVSSQNPPVPTGGTAFVASLPTRRNSYSTGMAIDVARYDPQAELATLVIARERASASSGLIAASLAHGKFQAALKRQRHGRKAIRGIVEEGKIVRVVAAM